MTASAPKAKPEPRRPLVIAVPEQGQALDGELHRVSWARTIWRLAVEPAQHPWSPTWALRSRGPLVAVAIATGVLALLLFSGCAGAPPQSLLQSTTSPKPSAPARCESLLVSRELQIPPAGELGDARLTIEDIPPVVGKLRVLVRRPRFPARLELVADGFADFDQVLEISPGAGQRDLTVVLARPRDAWDDWPRQWCRACRVDVELSGLFGAKEGLTAFFAQAMQDAAAIDADYARQSAEPASRPSPALREHAERLSADARRCGVAIEPALNAALDALDKVDRARALFYSGELPDAPAVLRAFRTATEALEARAPSADAAREAGWPASLAIRGAGRLRSAALHLELIAQAANLPREDRALAARWMALALAPDAAALEKRVAALPAIKDLDDARARLAWVDPQPLAVLPLPGASKPASLRVREFRAVRSGRRCIGQGGAVPVRDGTTEARALATLLHADGDLRLRVAQAADFKLARARHGVARELLCSAPRLEVADAFAGLEEKELGLVAQRLGALFHEIEQPGEGRDDLLADARFRAAALFCNLLSPENIQRRVTSVESYKAFLQGGEHVLELLPGSLHCDGRKVLAREIRGRLRDAYRAALEQHGTRGALCPVRAGRCPEEIAASVRELFGLSKPDLASVVAPRSRALEFPPPFGFGDRWVDKLDRCAREACDALSRLQSQAPAGQFEGPLCKPRSPGSELPQEVAIDRPEAPSSVTLSSCDANVGVRLTLKRRRDAGTLVAIASAHRFRYGSESVTRQSRHPQLGRIFERVADLSDPSDVSRRDDDEFEVAVTPTVENQTFYFFSLRRRDY
jgi:hypothetical protein